MGGGAWQLLVGGFIFLVNSVNEGCSKKLHLQSYLDMLWSETGYFGLLGNNLIFLLSYYILSKGKGL